MIGMAERGEMATRPTGTVAGDDSSFRTLPPVLDPNVPIPALTGGYQLEIRRGTTYGTVFLENASAPGQPAPLNLIRSFDTNDRDGQGFTLFTPAGNQITDGAGFVINDGYRLVRFEFNKSGGVSAGNVAVNITNSNTDSQVADILAQAIQAQVGLGLLRGVFATTSNIEANNSGVPRPNSNRVLVTGATTIDQISAFNPAPSLKAEPEWDDRVTSPRKGRPTSYAIKARSSSNPTPSASPARTVFWLMPLRAMPTTNEPSPAASSTSDPKYRPARSRRGRRQQRH